LCKYRPPPPVPEIQISANAVHQAALYLQSHVNKLLSALQSIALGKDADLFYASASVLWFLSVLGSLTSFTTSFYISKSASPSAVLSFFKG
jgi:reticulon-3